MDKFVALKVTPKNIEQIITEAPELTLSEIEQNIELASLNGMSYYLVTNFIGKNMREVYPWVMLREDFLRENFSYTLPTDDTEKFNITRN